MEGCTRREVVTALTSVTLSAYLYYKFHGSEVKKVGDHSSMDINKYSIRESDIIFVMGTSFVSSLIRASQVPFLFTHAGLLIKENDRLAVIDSDYEPDQARNGVSVQAVPIFLSKYDRVLVMSNSALLSHERHLISQAALRLRDKEFDLMLKPDVEKLYCTELIARSLMTSPDSPILLESNHYLTPKSLHDALRAKGWTGRVLANHVNASDS